MFESLKSKFTSFVDNVSQKTISEKDIDNVLWDFQLSLLENDVSMKVSEKLGEDLKAELVGEQLSLSDNKKKYIKNKLSDSILNILQSEPMDLFSIIRDKNDSGEPLVLIFIGFNGTGKTTSIAKLAHTLKEKGFTSVISASDTFRAGSIEQLEKHANNVGIKVIKHDYGADPAAVAFDAIKHAKARGIDAVLVDTAGRAETNKNLMDEMRKVIRVTKPDLKIFVGDALGGNAVVEQAEKFHDIGIDCSILTKVDADARGGAALSIAYVTKKPILFIGVGQSYDDLEPFDPKWMVDRLVP